MPPFFIVTKVLILKILLASLSGLSLSYEYGYHPSAEEFDNFLRETSKTWTRDLLANEHRRSWSAQNHYDFQGPYVPKFQHPSQKRKLHSNNHPYTHNNYTNHNNNNINNNNNNHNNNNINNNNINNNNNHNNNNINNNHNNNNNINYINNNNHNNNPNIHNHNNIHNNNYNNHHNNNINYNKKKNHLNKIYQHSDSIMESGNLINSVNKVPSAFSDGNIETSIDFNLFNSEKDKVPIKFHSVENNEFNIPIKYEESYENIHQNNNSDTSFLQDQTESFVDSAVENPLNVVNTISLNNPNNVQILPQSFQNKNNVSFPIFFKNPVTGIVYVISEIGKTNLTDLTKNNTIPIYITKEQYDRDLFLTKKYYSKICSNKTTNEKLSMNSTKLINKPIHLNASVLSTLSFNPPIHSSMSSLSSVSSYPYKLPTYLPTATKRPSRRPTILSISSNTTTQPQIIRLQKPNHSNSKPQTGKLPIVYSNPPPVMIRKNLTVNNQVKIPHKTIKITTTKRPIRKKKKKPLKNKKRKTKTKKKTSKRPGKKPVKVTSTRPSLPPTESLPFVVLGSSGNSKPNTTSVGSTLSTQMERPHSATTSTIFNTNPIASTSDFLSPISRSSVKNSNSNQEDINNFSAEPRTIKEDLYPGQIIANERFSQKFFEILEMQKLKTQIPDKSQTPLYRIRRDLKTTSIDLRNNETDPTKLYKNKMFENPEDSYTVPYLTAKYFKGPAMSPAGRSKSGRISNSQRIRSKGSKNSSRPSLRPRLQKKNQTNNLKPMFIKRKNNANVGKNPTVLPTKTKNSLNVTHKGGSKTFTTPLNSPLTTPRQRTNSKRRNDQDEDDEPTENEGFDIFDLFDTINGDEDDDDEADSDSVADDDDEYYYESEKVVKPKRKPSKSPSIQSSTDSDASTDASTEASTVASLDSSTDDLKEPKPEDNGSSAEEGADFGALEEDYTTTTVNNNLDYYEDFEEEDEAPNTSATTKANPTKKRIRRRPPTASPDSQSDEDYVYEDDDDADEEDSGGGIGNFFRMIFYPVQMVMSRIVDGFGTHEVVESQSKYPTYTMYNSEIDPDIDQEEEEESSSILGSWFGSWFGFGNRKTKKIGSTTVAPMPTSKPTEAPSWFDSWFGLGSKPVSTHSDPEKSEDNWLFNWFDSKPKSEKKKRTTTTTTTTAFPQVPILTIVDPLKNPQNWIGILAHHIINSTSTSTHKPPFLEMITKATTSKLKGITTTEHPDVPRHISYDKYQIWRLKPQDDYQVRILEDLKKSEDGVKLQWLKGPSLRGLTDVLVPPKMFIDLQGTLSYETIDHEVLIFDVGKAISYEKSKETLLIETPLKRPAKKPNQKLGPKTALAISWNKYYEFDDIVRHLEALRMRFPQLVELIHIGRSYEGRPLIVVKLEAKNLTNSEGENDRNSLKGDGAKKRLKFKKKSGQANAVFIEAGVHGLEWISPAASVWMINELIRIMKNPKPNPDDNYIRQTTWYIMPLINPDGYVYSHDYDRFWKKSRSRHISQPNNGILNSAMSWLQQKKEKRKVCYGVDLDRNWRYQWGSRGSSKSPCNEFYAGPVVFSEPETKALADFLIEQKNQIKLFTSMQAYGQLISFPTKANASFHSERMDDMLDVAMVGTDGLRKKGSKARYKIDSSNDLIEHRSGCSDAYAAYEIGIPFSYTLRLADNGVHGYLLPSSSIAATGRDAFEIITSMLDYI